MAVTAQPADAAAAISQSEACGPIEPKADEAKAGLSHSGRVEADEAGEVAQGKGQSKGGMPVSVSPGKHSTSQVKL